MNAGKLSRFGCTPQVLALIILLAIISALAGWFSPGLFVLSAVFLCLASYLTRRSVSQTIRELNEDADNLRQKLAEAKKELQQSTERVRLLELVCRTLTPSPSAETTGQNNPGRSTAGSMGRLPGQLGQYRLLEKLGAGGMGAVYRALHTRLKRPVALKILPAQLLHDDRAVARFHREIEAVGKLDHPNIVRASDAGEDGGWHFLVMELVEGLDLARLSYLLGPLPIADACAMARQVASALQHAHEHGLVHRDIKPSNLLLTPAGDVKMLDLGLARLFGEASVSEVLTATGAVMGTPDYMAPEQAFDPKSVDIRADLYSLGCTLYKLLAGYPPFDGPLYGTLGQKLLAHAQASVPPLRNHRPEVPEELATVVERLLAKKPEDRWRMPAEVAAALSPFVDGQKLSELFAQAQDRLAGSAALTADYPPVKPG